jgi:hypothetical protein
MRNPYISVPGKRSILLILSTLCLLQFAAAQVAPVDITVQLVPPYASRIVDYVAPGNEKLRIIALQRDLTQASYRFFLRMEVSVNGQVLFRTSRNWQPPYTAISPGTPVILGGADLQTYFDVNHLDFVNFNRDQYITNPNLPEGYTTICFTAYDYGRPDVAVSNTNCGNFFLTLPDPPLLNYPACGMQVKALSPQQLMFSWVPMNMGNTASASTVYELSLYENRDRRNPNDIVQNVAPIYTNRSQASTIVYGPGEPALQTGMSYVWRVQAIDENGHQAFKNNGFSQPCAFSYTTDSGFNWSNAQPLQIYAQAMNESNAKIGWQTDKDVNYDKYTVYYRKKGDTNSWFNNTLTDTVYFLSGLEANTSYETRVQGIKGASSGMYSNVVGFTTPQKKVVDCKQAAGILAAYNGRPYLKAMHNDIVHYGSFELTLNNVQAGQPGYYSGTGTVVIPFMANMTLAVHFSNIQIDDAMEVTAGEVIFDSQGVDAWLATTKTANQVIRNLVDAIKALTGSSIKGEADSLTALAKLVKELAQQEMPGTLIDSLNDAVDKMQNAKIAYDNAKQAYEDATTDEARQEAKNKMDTAEQQFNEAKQTVSDLEKTREQLAGTVAKYIVQAIKQLKAEVDSLQQDNTPATNATTGSTSDAGSIGVVILGVDSVGSSQAGAGDIENFESLSRSRLKGVAANYFALVKSLFNYYGDNDSATFDDDNAISGKELVKYTIDQVQQKVPEKELVQHIQDRLKSMLIIISKQL